MKKLGLCVRYDCNNYGSMLQIFATQQAINKFGWRYELVRYDKKTIGFLLKNVTRLFNPYFMNGKIEDLKKIRNLEKHLEIKKKNNERLKCIENYRKTHIGPYSKVYKGYKSLQEGAKNYDAVMVGSDQLWTPAGIQSKFYNLLFVPEDVRKIAFATSFGVVEIPKNQVEMTKEYLRRIQFLSVRENSGAAIVKKLTGRDIVVAADPTLLFSGKEWLSFFEYKRMVEKPYIFAYFLGDTKEHRAAVTTLAKEFGLEVVTCPHMDQFVEQDLNFGDEQLFDVGPIEFLNLIRGATYVCTDSFHGSIFSILNHKKFVTFNRYNDELLKSKNSRINSLFEILGLENRHYILGCTNIVDMMKTEIDYKEVDIRLESLRKKTFEFLETSLRD